jgi:hypothetical protein
MTGARVDGGAARRAPTADPEGDPR